MSDKDSIFFIKVDGERVQTTNGGRLFFHNDNNASSFARNLTIAVAWRTGRCLVEVEEICRDEIMGTFWGDEFESANYNRRQEIFKEVVSSLTGAPLQDSKVRVKKPTWWLRVLRWFFD